MAEIMLTGNDINWVYETHLKGVANVPAREEVQCAIIDGNPDCPTYINLYPNEIPNVDDPAMAIFVPDEDLKYVRKASVIYVVESDHSGEWAPARPWNSVREWAEEDRDEMRRRFPGDGWRVAEYVRKD